MKIVDARVETRRWAQVAANARQGWASREGRLVVLKDDEGRRGLGEASPLPGYGPESLREVDAALVGASERFWAPFDAHAGPGPFREALRSRLAGVGSPSARFALETASWDVWSQRRGLPLAVAWGAPATRVVATAALVDLMAPATWPHRSPAVIKVKVGRRGAWDAERAALVDLGVRYPGTPVRIDANQCFAGDVVADRLAALADLHADGRLTVAFVEEPSEGPWPSACGLTLGRDESLSGQAPAAALAADAVVVLKPTILGGLTAVDGWAALAATAVISHAFEGPIAHAAAAAWAVAFAPDVVAGLGPHAGLTAWPDVTPEHVRGDRLIVPSRPGLGYRRTEA